tara:strand:+ start:1089 stop:2537 length:1449 start_codon:yes stop_codon:yes gene_type:complete
MAAQIEVKYFNSFVLKNTVATSNTPIWDGSRGIPAAIGGYPRQAVGSSTSDWAIEEARIRGGYNNVSAGYGARAYLVEDEPNSAIRSNSLIYSGIFNSRTGINNTNVFSIGAEITKSADPANGSIQKLYAEDTNLIIFQEAKVSRALIDKDAIYSAEGGGAVTSSNLVIGVIQSFSGNFGISTNPESFASYGYRKYFTDKNNNAVLRLSMDGITEISNYGMKDFFRDNLNSIDSSVYGEGRLIGGFDIHNKQYVLSLQKNITDPTFQLKYNTVSFDEDVLGWPSFFTYNPSQSFSMLNNFYSLKDNSLWKHYYFNSSEPPSRGKFYGVLTPSSITFIFNPRPSMSKNFQTINYEGANGWQIDSIVSDSTGRDLELGVYSSSQDVTNIVYSYQQGSYDNYGNEYPNALIPPINRAGFDRKENKYFANLVNNSSVAPGEVLFGDSISGIKGYFVTVTISTDSVTNVGGEKELFAVSSNYVESSY